VGRIGELLPVRRDQGRAAIDAVVAAFRIHHHRLASFVGSIDDGANDARGERALGVIGQHYRACFGHRLDDVADQRIFAFGIHGRSRLPVGAQQVGRMMFGHKAHLAGRPTPGIGHQVRVDPRYFRQLFF
jgi:hypothetical protein